MGVVRVLAFEAQDNRLRARLRDLRHLEKIKRVSDELGATETRLKIAVKICVTQGQLCLADTALTGVTSVGGGRCQVVALDAMTLV